MKRRDFLSLVAGASAVAWPRRPLAQTSSRNVRVGYLAPGGRPQRYDTSYTADFVRQLGKFGYIEGRNLTVEVRYADWKYDRMRELAIELVRANVDVIVAPTRPAVRAAQAATTTIPIVMTVTDDPVQAGLVQSLARPEGNATGIYGSNDQTYSKQLGLLKAVSPNLVHVGLLVNPTDIPVSPRLLPPVLIEIAQSTGITITRTNLYQPNEIRKEIGNLKRNGVQALMMASTPLINARTTMIASAALANQLPSISQRREYVDAGGLMSYGESSAESNRRAAVYVDKLLKGAKPSELPIEMPTRFHHAINQRVASALKLKVPNELLATADDLID